MSETSRGGRAVRTAATSYAQESAWLLAELDPRSPADTVVRAFHVTGPLDLPALRASWRGLVEAHEMLRTTISAADGRAVQRIADAAVSDVDIQRAEDDVDRLCAAAAETVLRLDDLPARLRVVSLAGDRHLVLLTVHRAAADHAAIQLLVDQLSTGYTARVAGDVPPPVSGGRYAAFARWERDHVDSTAGHAAREWWTSSLTSSPELVLPVDRPRPPGPSHEGGAVRFDWGGEVSAALGAYAEAAGTTPATVLLAAVQAVLHRVRGENVVVGVPTSVRSASGWRETVGNVTNLLPHRTDFTGTPTFADVVAAVDRFGRLAREHGALPFAEIVRAVGGDRDPRRIPFCDMLFDVCETAPAPLRLAGADVTEVPVDPVAVRADLTLTVERQAPAVAGVLTYRASVVDRAVAEHLLAQVRTLLTAGMAEPSRPVRELPLDDRARLDTDVTAADRTDEPGPGQTVTDLVRAWATRRPDAPAVLLRDGSTVSYADLVRHADTVTARLLDLGVRPGQPVAVRMRTGHQQAASLLGVLGAGAHLVCLGAGDATSRGQAILADLSPVCVVTDGQDELADWYRSAHGGAVLDLQDLDTTADPGDLTVPCGPEDLAYVAYTSGSTGVPKGIATTHASISQFASWFAGMTGLVPGTRMAQWAAPGYDASLVEAFSALVAGATLCPVPDEIRVNPDKLVAWLGAERVSVFQTVPSFVREVLAAVNRAGSALTLSLDHLLLAGEVLPGDLAGTLRRALPDTRLVNLYGPTESILATWYPVTGQHGGPVPIGRSIPGRHVLVVDADGAPCPVGVQGEIVVRSPFVAPGYVGHAAGQRAAFDALPALTDESVRTYRTGDTGWRHPDGTLRFGGRRDFQVKFFGTRMELTEIEAVLAADDTVAECALVAVPNPEGLVTRLVAYVVPSRDAHGKAAAGAQAWRAVLRARFGKGALPVQFRTVIGLPRTAGGKVDRARLPDPAAITGATAEVTSTPTGHAVTKLWTRLLGTHVREDVSFFAVGGHSLLVPRLLAMVRERFGVEVPMWDFLTNPTPVELAALVDSRIAAASAVRQTMIG